MAIGVESLCKINANIGNSAIVSNVDEELRKLHTAVHFWRGYGDGSVDGWRYSYDSGADSAAFAGADRDGAVV